MRQLCEVKGHLIRDVKRPFKYMQKATNLRWKGSLVRIERGTYYKEKCALIKWKGGTYEILIEASIRGVKKGHLWKGEVVLNFLLKKKKGHLLERKRGMCQIKISISQIWIGGIIIGEGALIRGGKRTLYPCKKWHFRRYLKKCGGRHMCPPLPAPTQCYLGYAYAYARGSLPLNAPPKSGV